MHYGYRITMPSFDLVPNLKYFRLQRRLRGGNEKDLKQDATIGLAHYVYSLSHFLQSRQPLSPLNCTLFIGLLEINGTKTDHIQTQHPSAFLTIYMILSFACLNNVTLSWVSPYGRTPCNCKDHPSVQALDVNQLNLVLTCLLLYNSISPFCTIDLKNRKGSILVARFPYCRVHHSQEVYDLFLL